MMNDHCLSFTVLGGRRHETVTVAVKFNVIMTDVFVLRELLPRHSSASLKN